MAERRRKELTHKEIYVLGVRMSLELETQLVQIPNPHLGFVRSSRNNMVSVPSCFDFVASFRKFKMLDEFEGSFDMFPLRPFPFLRGTFPD